MKLTVNELEKLNKFRTLSKPFLQLGVGDEIDIPRGDGLFIAEGVVFNPSSSEQDIARFSTETAGALASGDLKGAAADKVRGLASDKATEEIQN